jgi:hypothetical protein
MKQAYISGQASGTVRVALNVLWISTRILEKPTRPAMEQRHPHVLGVSAIAKGSPATILWQNRAS